MRILYLVRWMGLASAVCVGCATGVNVDEFSKGDASIAGGSSSGGTSSGGTSSGGTSSGGASTGGVSTGGVSTGGSSTGGSSTGGASTGGASTGGASTGGSPTGGTGGIVTPTCTDNIKNGTETGVDCGGTCTTKCPLGSGCATDADCAAGTCVAQICSTCANGVKDGTETDVDCGGSTCPGCADGKLCTASSDCASRNCASGTCGASTNCLITNITGCQCNPPHPDKIPACQKVVQCWVDNSCTPTDPCTTNNDGACGVNTLQIDQEPLDAAKAVYACACQ